MSAGLERGRWLLERGEDEAALECLEGAWHDAPSPETAAWYVAGLRARQRFDDVERVAENAVRRFGETAHLVGEWGGTACDEARLDVADERLARALALADGDQDRARILGELVNLRRHQGRLPEAREALVEAVPLTGLAFGEESVEFAGILNQAGIIGKFDGAFDEALAAYERSLAILETVIGPEAEPLASLHHNLGGLAHARHDFAAGEPHGRRSVEIRRAARGDDHVYTALDKAAWASLLDGLRRSDEAEALLREAIPIIERDLGASHPELAVQFNNLAAILGRRREVEEAEALYRRALAIKEAAAGPRSTTLAPTLNNLGLLLKRAGRTDEAARLFARGIAVLEGNVADDHPTLASLRRNASGVV